MKHKAFFIIFIGLSDAKSGLRSEIAPLTHITLSVTCMKQNKYGLYHDRSKHLFHPNGYKYF